MNSMKKLPYRQNNRKNGFTLVETLVAITILLVAIAGPMTIAARGLQTAFFAREQITAFMLAQEGVELIRNFRDENALARAGWLDGLPPECGTGTGCGADVRGNVRNCGSKSCQINYDAGILSGKRGFYTYDTGADTSLSQFTRKILVESISGGEAKITVTVSWRSGLLGDTKTVMVQSRIFDQYDYLR